MSDKFRKRIIHSLLYGRSFLLSILIGVLCGLVCGLVGCAFLAVTDLAYARSGLWPWTIFFLPLAGLLIVFLYHRAGVYEDRGTNLVLVAVREHEHPDFCQHRSHPSVRRFQRQGGRLSADRRQRRTDHRKAVPF